MTQTNKFPTLSDLFKTDFPNLLRVDKTSNWTIQNIATGAETKYDVQYSVYMDFGANSKFMGMYLACSKESYAISETFSQMCRQLIKDIDAGITTIAKYPGDSNGTSSDTLSFTGRVYIYHDDDFSLQEKAKLDTIYKDNGLSVVFRGHDYLMLNMWKPNNSNTAQKGTDDNSEKQNIVPSSDATEKPKESVQVSDIALIDKNGHYKEEASIAEIAECWAKEGCHNYTSEIIAAALIERIRYKDFLFYLSNANPVTHAFLYFNTNSDSVSYEGSNILIKLGNFHQSEMDSLDHYIKSITRHIHKLHAQGSYINNVFSDEIIQYINDNISAIRTPGKGLVGVYCDAMSKYSMSPQRDTDLPLIKDLEKEFLQALPNYIFMAQKTFLRWLRLQRHSLRSAKFAILNCTPKFWGNYDLSPPNAWLPKYNVALENRNEGILLKDAFQQLNDQSAWAEYEREKPIKNMAIDIPFDIEKRCDEVFELNKAGMYKRLKLRFCSLFDDNKQWFVMKDMKGKVIPYIEIRGYLDSDDFDFEYSKTKDGEYKGVRVYRNNTLSSEVKPDPIKTLFNDTEFEDIENNSITALQPKAKVKRPLKGNTSEHSSAYRDAIIMLGMDANTNDVLSYLRSNKDKYPVFTEIKLSSHIVRTLSNGDPKTDNLITIRKSISKVKEGLEPI